MVKCSKIKVPEKVCHLEFKKGKVDHSEDIGCTNGEEMVGIELVGDKKPCQKASSAKNVRKK